MRQAEKITKLLDCLAHLNKDAEMALDDIWDRSDSGFKNQIWLIEKTLAEADLELPDISEEDV